MRKLALREKLIANGMQIEERFGVEIGTTVSGFDKEYDLIRNNVGITDFSFMQKYTVPEESGLDFLDELFAGNIARIRFGRMLHTFLADSDGNIIADAYIANNDEEFIILCESLVEDADLDKLFADAGGEEAGLKNVSDTHVVLSIDGYKSWSVAKDLFGTDVLGLPYLSIEMYPFEDQEVCLFRSGKTSEFGYLIMAENGVGEKLYDTLLEKAKEYNGGLCGVNIHNDLRLEGRFFNIFAEGKTVKDPLALGLQWMIDFDKDNFIGSEAILAKRDAGIKKKIIGLKGDKNLNKFTSCENLYDGDTKVGVMQTVCFSPVLDAKVGLALIDIDYAFAGLEFSIGEAGGETVESISMPPIIPKSLSLRLDEM